MLVAACGGAVGSPDPSSTLPPEARGALEQIYVDGHAYTLQADLYRDLMPGPAPTPKRGVGGTIFLTPDAESDPPQGMHADRTWLVNGTDIWRPSRTRFRRSRSTASIIYRSASSTDRPGTRAPRSTSCSSSVPRAGPTSYSTALRRSWGRF